MTRKQVGEERVYLTYIFKLLFITEGSQEQEIKQYRNLETGTDAEAMEGYFLVSCSQGMFS